MPRCQEEPDFPTHRALPSEGSLVSPRSALPCPALPCLEVQPRVFCCPNTYPGTKLCQAWSLQPGKTAEQLGAASPVKYPANSVFFPAAQAPLHHRHQPSLLGFREEIQELLARCHSGVRHFRSLCGACMQPWTQAGGKGLLLGAAHGTKSGDTEVPVLQQRLGDS